MLAWVLSAWVKSHPYHLRVGFPPPFCVILVLRSVPYLIPGEGLGFSLGGTHVIGSLHLSDQDPVHCRKKSTQHGKNNFLSLVAFRIRGSALLEHSEPFLTKFKYISVLHPQFFTVPFSESLCVFPDCSRISPRLPHSCLLSVAAISVLGALITPIIPAVSKTTYLNLILLV